MPVIESQQDIESYQDVFDGLWQSATLRVSILEIEDEIRVPNGELLLNWESMKEHEKVLFDDANFRIVEKTVSNPFDFVKELAQGELIIEDSQIESSLSLIEGNTRSYFQQGINESRVSQDRPLSELQGVITVKHDRDADYKRELNRAEEAIKNADEPYFSLNKCEFYYFDYHFRGTSNADPRIIIIGKTKTNLEVNEENVLSLTYPEIIEDKLDLNVYPLRPYGKHPGQKIRISEQETESTDNGLKTYTKEFDLSDIEELYFSVYGDDEPLLFEEHHNPDIELENDRFRIFNTYDQKGDLARYLTGEKDTNQFEKAVLNLFSIAGYAVKWFGDSNFKVPNYSRDTPEPEFGEIDIIAHAPDNSRILFIECTTQDISAKEHVVDRMENVTADKRETEVRIAGKQWAGKRMIPCVATPQSEGQLSEESVKALRNRNITVLNGQDLVNLYETSMEQNEYVEIGPDSGFWLQQHF